MCLSVMEPSEESRGLEDNFRSTGRERSEGQKCVCVSLSLPLCERPTAPLKTMAERLAASREAEAAPRSDLFDVSITVHSLR